nr:T9SS type A sorting domain-containing protein [Bacteroidales bacterium]
ENTTTNNALNRISKYYTEYKYNTDNLLTELTQYYWNNTNQSWNYYNSQYFNYDTNNILINQTYFEEDTARVEFTYNESVLLSECIMPQYEKHPINSNLYKYMLQQAEYCVWNSKQENWEPQSRSTMYYSEQINSSINKLTANIEVYPNPTSDILIIKCSDNFSNAVFQIFDLNGEKLYYNKIKNHTTIDLSWLKNGVYGYSIVSDNTIKKGKILKQ